MACDPTSPATLRLAVTTPAGPLPFWRTAPAVCGHALRATALWLALCAVLLVAAWPSGAVAQTVPGVAANSTAAAAPSDPYGRETPRGLADGLVAALADRNYERASAYFDLSDLPASRRAEQGATYARRLKAALDAGGSLVPFLQLSGDPAGRVNDQLPLDQDQIGKLPPRPGSPDPDGTPLIAEATSDGGTRVWQISAATLAALPPVTAVEAGEQDRLRGVLPAALTQTQIGGAPLSDWIILLVMAAGFYALIRLLFAVVLALVRRFKRGHEDSRSWRLLHAASSPLSLYLAVLLFLQATQPLHVAIVARQFVSRYAGAVLLLSFAWFLWRLIDVVADFAATRMEKAQRRRAQSILVFARRGLKIMLLAFAAIAALGAIGIDVTTGIAALGLGGLALALGAQKTVENIVGSISVIADEPVRVGDFCRVGDVVGTVEDIGIRSTRIRTNERTRVTIPNGNFAALQIENFALRDRFLFNPTLNLARNLDADGVESVLEAVRAALEAADYLFPGGRATFAGLGASSLDIEVFGWIDVPDFERSLYLRERLLLDIMRRVAAAGGSFALPTTAVHLDSAEGLRGMAAERGSDARDAN